MEHIGTLWLPTLLSAVLVFFAGALIQMMTPWHRSDYPGLPDEEAFRNAVRPLSIPPGDYTVPKPVWGKEMRGPEMARKLAEGPHLMMTVLPNGMKGMVGYLAYQFIYVLFVSWFAGHLAQASLNASANHHVWQMVGGVAFAAYGLALWPLAIWYHRSLKTTIKANVDALIYAAITAATFAWLWPK